ncbi:MAG: hypothetical protein IKN43_01980 [Selenomonadaceae bacterium]|nr:hypothetical protein [Selenomonadaceae bacterium]
MGNISPSLKRYNLLFSLQALEPFSPVPNTLLTQFSHFPPGLPKPSIALRLPQSGGTIAPVYFVLKEARMGWWYRITA